MNNFFLIKPKTQLHIAIQAFLLTVVSLSTYFIISIQFQQELFLPGVKIVDPETFNLISTFTDFLLLFSLFFCSTGIINLSNHYLAEQNTFSKHGKLELLVLFNSVLFGTLCVLTVALLVLFNIQIGSGPRQGPAFGWTFYEPLKSTSTAVLSISAGTLIHLYLVLAYSYILVNVVIPISCIVIGYQNSPYRQNMVHAILVLVIIMTVLVIALFLIYQ